MVDILHKVGIKSSSLEAAYQALTTLEGLSAWWTSNTQGESKVGGVLKFRFGAGGFDMKVLELQPDKSVQWQVVDGPQEWVGSRVSMRTADSVLSISDSSLAETRTLPLMLYSSQKIF